MAAPPLSLRNIVKRFPGFDLGPVTLTLEPGCAYGLLGPNGAGKSTLLNVMTLQSQATSGEVWYGERRIGWGDRWWKECFAYVRETPAFYPELTVAQTIAFAEQLYARWDPSLAEQMIEQFALPRQKRVSTLSKGMRVKLGLAAALAQRADVLLLDEPTAGVDPDAREDLYRVVAGLRAARADVCLVVSTHIFEDVDAMAEEAFVLRHGQIVRHLRAADAHGNGLRAAYKESASGAGVTA